MSHFYGEIKGNRGEATRQGTANSGFRSHIRGWNVGGSINCHYNESKDRDEVCIAVTGGSNGYSNHAHLANIIEVDNKPKIYLNWHLDKLVSEEEYIQLKDDISELISGKVVIGSDKACNQIAEAILDQLNFKLDNTKE